MKSARDEFDESVKSIEPKTVVYNNSPVIKMVRAKFIVTGYETSLQDKEECRAIKLQAVHGTYGDSPENKEFFKYTPFGEIKMGLLKPSTWAKFELGKSYYVDFTPADPVS